MSNFEEHKETDGLEVFFNKTLYESSMQPSTKSWENIEQKLNQEEKRKKRLSDLKILREKRKLQIEIEKT